MRFSQYTSSRSSSLACPSNARNWFGYSRGSIALQQASRAFALLERRSYVLPEDIRRQCHGVLRHRLHLGFQAIADDVRPETIIDAVMAAVPTP